MKPSERHKRIIDLVQEKGRVAVEDLAVLLDTSRETVRRDLSVLSENGLLRKIHGGATAVQAPLAMRESPLAERRASARMEKIRIARAAAARFKGVESLLINCGTTTIFFAEELAKRGSFTVITNSTLIAHEMWSAADRSPIHLLGGSYFGEAYELLGPQTIEQIQHVAVDHAVIGVSGVGVTGVMMDFNAEEAYVSRAMIRSARHVTVLADSTKLQRNALFHVCRPEEVDLLITDKRPEAGLESALKLAGVEIAVAETEEPEA